MAKRTRDADRSTTAREEAARTGAAREETAARERQDRPATGTDDASTTDEGLGLTPRGSEIRTEPSDAELAAVDRLRAADPGDGPDFRPSGQFTGLPTDDRSPRSAPGEQAEIVDEEPDLTTTPHTLGATGRVEADVDPSLMDQEILADPIAAPGAGDGWEDPVSEGDETYVPPTDPVITSDARGEAKVLGGFSTTAMGEAQPLRSASDGEYGDEAIADAVRAALRMDASTTDLRIHVLVEGGVVRLRGRVPGMEDADNAEAVAGRVPGVVDVIEELEVGGV